MWLLLLVACEPFDPTVDHGVDVPTTDPDESIAANLAVGAPMADLGWAHDAFCWSGASDDAFTGDHVLFTRTQPADQDVYLRVKPADDVDVSLYYVQAAQGVTDVPPDLAATDVFHCAAQFLVSGNPGQAETLLAAGSQELPLTIGVAGTDGAAVGSFTLEIWGLPGE